MPVLSCPACGHVHKFGEHRLGESVRCKECGKKFMVEEEPPLRKRERRIEDDEDRPPQRQVADEDSRPRRKRDEADNYDRDDDRRPELARFAPINFKVMIKRDPEKEMRGTYRARLTPKGLFLLCHEGDYKVPVGAVVLYFGKNQVLLPLEGRDVLVAVTGPTVYGKRLARDLVEFLTGQKPEMSRREYFVPVPILLLSILPAGIAFFGIHLRVFGPDILQSTLNGALWGFLAGGLIVGTRLLLMRESWPMLARVGAVLVLTAAGYVAPVILYIQSLAPATFPDMPIAQAEWREFAPPEARCSILMPGIPQVQEQVALMPQGRIPVHLYTVERKQEQRAFVLAYRDYPAEAVRANPERIVDDVQEGAFQSFQANQINVSTINLDGFRGCQIKLQSRKGIWLGRYYLVQNRLYQVVVAGPGVHADSPAVNKFLDSFKLRKEDGKPKAK